jgi:flagellar hook protein FlgE
MLSALFTGISGLKANMSSMSVIGDNLANLNTIGFKGSRISFADLLAQNITGSSGTNQIGLGVKLSNVSPIFKQGSLESTGNATDLAIEGDGFFVVRDNVGTNHYTRAGQFAFDKDGYMINPEGYIARGYTADSFGNLGNIVSDIQLSNAPVPPLATQNIDLAVNVDSDDDVQGFVFTAGTNDEINFTASAGAVTASLITDGGLVAGRNYSGAQVANAIKNAMGALSPADTFSVAYSGISGTFDITNNATNAGNLSLSWTTSSGAAMLGFTADSGALAPGSLDTSDVTGGAFDVTDATNTANFATAIAVFDSLGNSHQVAVYFRKSATAPTGNTWEWFAVVDAADTQSGVTEIQAQGSVDFTNTGALAGEITTSSSFNFAGGSAQNQLIALDFGDSIAEGFSGVSGTTQYAQDSSVTNQYQDGYASGDLQSVYVDQAGTLVGVFSNGITRVMAQLVLAQFSSPENLKKDGGNLFLETLSSGQALVSAPGNSGLGTIHSNSLELSTVDISEEFVRMITAQRGFQANSRIITTSDDMLAELVNLKR